MLEPTESTESVKDSASDTPSDTLPPRRRRRAASRPAGPPTATVSRGAPTGSSVPSSPKRAVTTPP
ncbi:hypothetical protein [Streptomyces sp. NPDC059378]|uniref:hypothetical protein n=1 Tax=Streptomyces sp. NPDC059378 TaxID=3346815 RepID=UPI0036BF36A9